jgi:hypothetical protein
MVRSRRTVIFQVWWRKDYCKAGQHGTDSKITGGMDETQCKIVKMKIVFGVASTAYIFVPVLTITYQERQRVMAR